MCVRTPARLRKERKPFRIRMSGKTYCSTASLSLSESRGGANERSEGSLELEKLVHADTDAESRVPAVTWREINKKQK